MSNASMQYRTAGPKTSRQKIGRKIWANRWIYLMILPVMVYYILFHYWPMLWLRIAFYDFRILKGFEGSKFVGWKHFQSFMSNPDFLTIMWNTLYLNILSLIFSFPAPIIFAIFLNELAGGKFKKGVQTISYLPHFLSIVVVVSMIRNILSPSMGIVNSILKQLGGKETYFIGEPGYFRPIMIISGIWQEMGWSSIIFLSAIAGINTELYESAVIDGANRWKQVLHITLPGISQTIIVMLILRIGSLLSVGFEKVYLMQNPHNLGVSEVLSTYVYKRGMVNNNYSLATAVGLFNGAISLVLVAVANKLSKKYSEISLI